MSELIFENGEEEKLRVPEAEENNGGVDKGMEILNNPIHGMYIPSILMICGSIIMYLVTSYKRCLVFIPMTIFIVLYRFFLAINKKKVNLNFDTWSRFELDDKFIISRDSCIYTFKLGSEDETLNCPPGSSVAIQAFEHEETGEILFELPKENDVEEKEESEEEEDAEEKETQAPLDISKYKEICRFYNPISSSTTKGTFDLLIKSNPNGKFSKKIASNSYKGLQLNFKGFIGTYDHNKSILDYSKFVMLAGGSGLTPMLQVISKIIEDKTKGVDIELIYCNKTKKDILLKNELDEINDSQESINVTYITDDDEGLLSFVDIKDKVEDLENTRFLICGNQGFRDHALDLLSKNYEIDTKGNKQVFVF
ncbi:hypothetical protein ACO0SA_003396 [Hanseniaspora valbyensis]